MVSYAVLDEHFEENVEILLSRAAEQELQPNTEEKPYESYYAARKTLLTLRNTLSQLLKLPGLDAEAITPCPTEEDIEEIQELGADQTGEALLLSADDSEAFEWSAGKQRLAGMLSAVVDARLGMNYVNAEETGVGGQYLARCLPLLRAGGDDLREDCIKAHNSLGVLWSTRADYAKAKGCLDVSRVLCERMLEQEEDSGWLADSYTQCLFFLAQVTGKNNQQDQSAKYCLATMNRQLKFRATSDYDPVEWCQNAIQMSGGEEKHTDTSNAVHSHTQCNRSAQSQYGGELLDMFDKPDPLPA